MVRKVVIIGMGYIALEMCEALRARDIEVEMVKPRPRFLPWMAEELAQVVKKELEDNGVALHLGHSIEKIEAKGDRLQVTCPDLALDADMVLVAMGIKPNSELAARAGIVLGAGNGTEGTGPALADVRTHHLRR